MRTCLAQGIFLEKSADTECYESERYIAEKVHAAAHLRRYEIQHVGTYDDTCYYVSADVGKL